ncbi:MAG TPA: hypothetical protein DDY14_15105 [Chromatiaceae bacterium]|nr:MAG: hypothetical protein N838_09685 [Thiohalocapsa sp. PB-PSB1]HBG96611.1 hypothetical protein [Chromatiaceae bacterium]HCS91421.1 hypothetical protein [Chromatiaceae bacterium]
MGTLYVLLGDESLDGGRLDGCCCCAAAVGPLASAAGIVEGLACPAVTGSISALVDVGSGELTGAAIWSLLESAACSGAMVFASDVSSLATG